MSTKNSFSEIVRFSSRYTGIGVFVALVFSLPLFTQDSFYLHVGNIVFLVMASAVGFHLWAMTMDDPGPYVPTDACLFGIILCGPLVAILGAVVGAIVGAKRTKNHA